MLNAGLFPINLPCKFERMPQRVSVVISINLNPFYLLSLYVDLCVCVFQFVGKRCRLLVNTRNPIYWLSFMASPLSCRVQCERVNCLVLQIALPIHSLAQWSLCVSKIFGFFLTQLRCYSDRLFPLPLPCALLQLYSGDNLFSFAASLLFFSLNNNPRRRFVELK